MQDQDALVRRIARHEFPDPRVVPVRDAHGRPAPGAAAARHRDDPADIRRAERLVRDTRHADPRVH